ncbi:hypothetical protein LINGRAHAP2_LOCUS13011 [Linum grandiflorum]
MGSPPPQETILHPPRRHRLRLQRHVIPYLPAHLQLPAHLPRHEPQLEDRGPLRQARRLRALQEPADHAPHAHHAFLPGQQGSQRLVAVCVWNIRPCRAIQRGTAFARPGSWERDADG